MSAPEPVTGLPTQTGDTPMILAHYLPDGDGDSPALTPPAAHLRPLASLWVDPLGLAPWDAELVEDALDTFGARFVAGAPSTTSARDALTAMGTWLLAQEHDLAGEPASLDHPVPCYGGCGFPTVEPSGTCLVCAEVVLRDGETLAQAATRVRRGELTGPEVARLLAEQGRS